MTEHQKLVALCRTLHYEVYGERLPRSAKNWTDEQLRELIDMARKRQAKEDASPTRVCNREKQESATEENAATPKGSGAGDSRRLPAKMKYQLDTGGGRRIIRKPGPSGG